MARQILEGFVEDVSDGTVSARFEAVDGTSYTATFPTDLLPEDERADAVPGRHLRMVVSEDDVSIRIFAPERTPGIEGDGPRLAALILSFRDRGTDQV